MTDFRKILIANRGEIAIRIMRAANEMGNIARAAGIDGTEVMRVLCLDDRLNISKAYMMPGFAFGGSCLPKDLRAIRAQAAARNLPTPVFDAALTANAQQIENAALMVDEAGEKSVAMMGLTFKNDTDDLRESPLVTLAQKLGIEMPICEAVNAVLSDQTTLSEAMSALLARPYKGE